MTGSFGEALVMSSFIAVVVTGLNVIFDTSFDAAAMSACWSLTGTHAAPSN